MIHLEGCSVPKTAAPARQLQRIKSFFRFLKSEVVQALPISQVDQQAILGKPSTPLADKHILQRDEKQEFHPALRTYHWCKELPL